MASDVTLCAKGCDDGVYTCFEYDFSLYSRLPMSKRVRTSDNSVPPDDGASTASKSAASLVDDAQDGRYFTDIIYNLADELAVDLKVRLGAPIDTRVPIISGGIGIACDRT